MNNRLKIINIILAIVLLPCCGSRPKKIVFDYAPPIDFCLSEDEYGSNQEQIHASELARRNQKSYQDEINDHPIHAIAPEHLASHFEAKLADLPLPLDITPIDQYFKNISLDSSDIVLGYISEQTINDLVLFFKNEMEPFGWHKIAHVVGMEQLLTFEKHQQVCSISLRSRNGWFNRSYTEIILSMSL